MMKEVLSLKNICLGYVFHKLDWMFLAKELPQDLVDALWHHRYRALYPKGYGPERVTNEDGITQCWIPNCPYGVYYDYRLSPSMTGFNWVWYSSNAKRF